MRITFKSISPQTCPFSTDTPSFYPVFLSVKQQPLRGPETSAQCEGHYLSLTFTCIHACPPLTLSMSFKNLAHHAMHCSRTCKIKAQVLQEIWSLMNKGPVSRYILFQGPGLRSLHFSIVGLLDNQILIKESKFSFLTRTVQRSLLLFGCTLYATMEVKGYPTLPPTYKVASTNDAKNN